MFSVQNTSTRGQVLVYSEAFSFSEMGEAPLSTPALL